MKFAIFAVVVLAIVTSSRASGIPWLAVSGPGGAIAAPGSIAVQASLAHGPVAAVAVHAIPNIVAAPAAVAVGHAGVVAGQAGATYVAKTRGVAHVAPLPGHIQSAASLNILPAPGTH